MPLWQIYHPEPAFSAADKRAIAQKVTALYQDFATTAPCSDSEPCRYWRAVENEPVTLA